MDKLKNPIFQNCGIVDDIVYEYRDGRLYFRVLDIAKKLGYTYTRRSGKNCGKTLIRWERFNKVYNSIVFDYSNGYTFFDQNDFHLQNSMQMIEARIAYLMSTRTTNKEALKFKKWYIDNISSEEVAMTKIMSISHNGEELITAKDSDGNIYYCKKHHK